MNSRNIGVVNLIFHDFKQTRSVSFNQDRLFRPFRKIFYFCGSVLVDMRITIKSQNLLIKINSVHLDHAIYKCLSLPVAPPRESKLGRLIPPSPMCLRSWLQIYSNQMN